MQALHTEICNSIEDHDRLSFISVAEFIGSTKQEMSNYKAGKRGLSFRKLLRISYLLYPTTQKEVMRGWCLRLNTPEGIQQSFEYASITRDKELLGKLLEKYKDEKGVLAKYISVYSILYRYYMYEFEADQLISELRKVKSLPEELYILAEIMKCYNYYFLGKYALMLETAQEAEILVSELGERRLFIKECYLHRIAEVLGNVSLFFNDIEATRFYAFVIINADMCPKTVSDAYYLVGMTYLIEDKLKCIEYLRKRYEISKGTCDSGIIENARRDLDFAKLYLSIKLSEDSDPILIKLQENRGSEFELRLIKEAAFQKGDDDFLTLLSAMAHGSVTKLHECLTKFLEDSNFYFASLAAAEVKKTGDNHFLVNEAIKYKNKTKGDVEYEEAYIKCFNRHGSIYRDITA
ncbi:AimR family lysis-lysogeny pheromone receptor [Peribacillus butanolivorans]|uniref:AimR family lysis-lysogeny pheromone receptor n=1 Tax=Peribacillus butanolivorans TaxID=421767 RepID=UPI00207D6EA6|nr:AimR family lysis-lysogeny pheromone receptor [Peribacillus butanolivorans]